MTTLPGTDTQTAPTLCKPDSQPWVKHSRDKLLLPKYITQTPSSPGIPCQFVSSLQAEDPGQAEVHS